MCNRHAVALVGVTALLLAGCASQHDEAPQQAATTIVGTTVTTTAAVETELPVLLQMKAQDIPTRELTESLARDTAQAMCAARRVGVDHEELAELLAEGMPMWTPTEQLGYMHIAYTTFCPDHLPY